MPAKIRLQRHGKKGKPFYHIVVADARAPRDGKYIERLGSYNPNTNPATIDLDVDGAANWLKNGAQPTDTARAILSYTGALYKNHLHRGVLKGALTEAEAEKRFEAWKTEKENKIATKSDKISAEQKAIADAKLAAEKEVNEAKAKALAEKEAELTAEAEAAVAAEEATEEAAPAEETSAEEAPAEENNEEKAAE